MSSYTALTDKTATQLLEAVRPVEEAALTFVTAARKITSKAPALPFADLFPTPAEVLVASATFGERLHGAQKEFGQRLASASTPIVVPAQDVKEKTPTAAKA